MMTNTGWNSTAEMKHNAKGGTAATTRAMLKEGERSPKGVLRPFRWSQHVCPAW